MTEANTDLAFRRHRFSGLKIAQIDLSDGLHSAILRTLHIARRYYFGAPRELTYSIEMTARTGEHQRFSYTEDLGYCVTNLLWPEERHAMRVLVRVARDTLDGIAAIQFVEMMPENGSLPLKKASTANAQKWRSDDVAADRA